MSPYFIHTSNLATANRLLHKKSTSILILNPFTPTYFYIRHHICIPTYKLRPYTSLCLQPMLTFHPVLYIHLCTCFYTCTTHTHSLSFHNLHMTYWATILSHPSPMKTVLSACKVSCLLPPAPDHLVSAHHIQCSNVHKNSIHLFLSCKTTLKE